MNRQNTSKNGFTLAEVLLVLIMTGILAVLSIQTVVYQTNNYKHLYVAAFNNIGNGVGNMISRTPNGKATYGKDPDGNAATFCQLLANEYHMSNPDSTCTKTYNLSPVGSFTDGSITPDQPSFTLTNGQRFYITNTFTPVGAKNYFDEPATLIVVDLNGTDDPNVLDTKTYSKARRPDIVAFAVTESGRVFPMSPLGDDDAHFLVDVQQCSTTNGCDSDLTKNIIAKYIPLRQGLCMANKFPEKGAASALTVQYNTDSTFNFNKTYAVDSRCNSATNYCRVLPLDNGSINL